MNLAITRTTERLVATTSYQSINASGECVFGIMNNSGQIVTIRLNSGTGEVNLQDGVFWELAQNVSGVTSLIEIKLDSGTGNVDYII